MSETEPTPEEQAEANNLSFTKNAANEQLIRFLNGLSTNALRKYPEAEVQTWPYQKAEAQAVIDAGAGATLEMAPLLTQVCSFEFGPATDTERLAQVTAKATSVHANSVAWSALAAAINGVRSRAQDLIEAATDSVEVSTILSEAQVEAAGYVSLS